MDRVGLALTSPSNLDLPQKSNAPNPRKTLTYHAETVWMNIGEDDESKELGSLRRWFEKNFPDDSSSLPPTLIKEPKGKDIDAKIQVMIINKARIVKYKAQCVINDGPLGRLYPIMADVRELRSLMVQLRRDLSDREIRDFLNTSAQTILDWSSEIELEYSRRFIVNKRKDGVGIRGNLTEIAEWGTAGILDFEGLDRYPQFIDSVGNGEQSDSMYLGILMHYLPSIIFQYLEKNLDRPVLVDKRERKLLVWEDLKLNEVFLTEVQLLKPNTTDETGWQGYLPAPLDAVTRRDAINFYREFELSDEERSLRIGLINMCMHSLSATINAEINAGELDDEVKYKALIDIRNIISRNFAYILAAIESIIYFFETEIGFENIKTLDARFEDKCRLNMKFVSPYKYEVMHEMDRILQRFNLRFSTRVGVSMRTDMIVNKDGRKIVIDFKSTVHYDGSFESKIKAIGYVLAEILKKIWGGTYSPDAEAFIISGITFDTATVTKIMKELKNIEFYFWGLKDAKVVVDISEEDMMNFLKLTKLHTQCMAATKTKSTKEERESLIAFWLPDESQNVSDSVEEQ